MQLVDVEFPSLQHPNSVDRLAAAVLYSLGPV